MRWIRERYSTVVKGREGGRGRGREGKGGENSQGDSIGLPGRVKLLRREETKKRGKHQEKLEPEVKRMIRGDGEGDTDL